ncbi:hypothetical protein CCP3SC15_130021 [Gammaproteobacteria bacterium]
MLICRRTSPATILACVVTTTLLDRAAVGDIESYHIYSDPVMNSPFSETYPFIP